MCEPTYSLHRISAILTLCGFMMGMDVTSLVVFLGQDYFNEFFHHPGPLLQGTLSAASPVGGLTGCFVYSLLCKRYGRVTLFRAGAVLWVLGSLVGAGSLNIWMVIVSRWVKGIDVGIYSVLLTAYCGEVIARERKGSTMAFVQCSCSLAVLTMYCLCAGLNLMRSELSFRLAWALGTVPAVILLLCSVWLPESPVWLSLQGRYDLAQHVQNQLAASYNSMCHGRSQIEVLEKLDLAAALKDESDGFAYIDLFKNGCLRQTLMASSMQLLVQFSGMGILMYYITFICDMIGLEGQIKNLAASIPYIISLSLSLLPILFLDQMRRKDVTLAGGFPLGLIMISIAAVMYGRGHRVEPIKGNHSLVWSVDQEGGPFVLALCFLFVSVYALTLSSGPWIYTNEILPTRAKSKGLSLSMSIGWLAGAILTLLGPLMMEHLKWATFLLLGSGTLLLSTLIAFLFPDTRDLSEHQIDMLYTKRDDSSRHEELPECSDDFPRTAGAGDPIELIDETAY
ncbi:YFL040W [Zygosaccharomyces parabailii]|uniref:ZYBA0S15-00870g1_1 n=1 Tax=Zygosaccharomyces bailii (strain CLIB 213 / ATCC 58445 / CBS 680 / BCRC 21525 / NBRC 1098 / NCYC 1416 / NRRL Y-2227) TaxID=1333698 RepID=A0A8J2TAL1_ZYGB2|nr:YFL040W [Zygosaccharomyces parabailii]CDF91888.1 ZYBA0S15-00870g1_1 [Zygosaccharomyces bailii CLIB 213]CDH13886.1 related to metabolite transport protein YFL040W [Zygosaccharomyces bailii ISA1307]